MVYKIYQKIHKCTKKTEVGIRPIKISWTKRSNNQEKRGHRSDNELSGSLGNENIM